MIERPASAEPAGERHPCCTAEDASEPDPWVRREWNVQQVDRHAVAEGRRPTRCKQSCQCSDQGELRKLSKK